MLEDLEKILNCESSTKMTQAIYLLRKIDPELIKDGFRVLYSNYHFEDFQHMIRGYKSLQKLTQEEQTWLQKFFFAIL